ncbi:MAG: hypothetical protein WA799_06935 [Nitrosotalea sp.]
MTIQKTIKILDYLITKRMERKTDFLDAKHSWNQNGDGKILKDIILLISGCMQDEINSLQMVRKQLVPKCKHPKKFRDIDPDGKPYCVGCNLDL